MNAVVSICKSCARISAECFTRPTSFHLLDGPVRCHPHLTDEESKAQKGFTLAQDHTAEVEQEPSSGASSRPGSGGSPALPDEARGRAPGGCRCPGPRGGARRAVARSAARPPARRTAPRRPPAPAAPPAAPPGPPGGPAPRRRPAPPAAPPEPARPRAAAAPPPRRLRPPPPGTAGARGCVGQLSAWAPAFPFQDQQLPGAPAVPRLCPSPALLWLFPGVDPFGPAPQPRATGAPPFRMPRSMLSSLLLSKSAHLPRLPPPSDPPPHWLHPFSVASTSRPPLSPHPPPAGPRLLPPGIRQSPDSLGFGTPPVVRRREEGSGAPDHRGPPGPDPPPALLTSLYSEKSSTARTGAEEATEAKMRWGN